MNSTANNEVSVTFEIDSDIPKKFNEIFEPQGITLEDAVREFLEFCATPGNENQVAELLRDWQAQADAD